MFLRDFKILGGSVLDNKGELDNACAVGLNERQCMLVTCWAAAFLLGCVTAPIGVTVQGLIVKHHLTHTLAGLIPFMMGAGRLITAAGSGWMSDLHGRRPVFAVGCVVSGAGAVVYALSSWWWISLASMLAIGLGVGLLDVSANAMAADLSVRNRQLGISRLQAFFGVGSIAAPIATAVCVSAGLGWEPVYLAAGIAFLALLSSIHPPLVPIQLVRRLPPSGASSSAARSDPGRIKNILGSRVFAVLVVVSFVYGGLSRTVLAWTNTYITDTMETSPLASMYPVILYNIGLAIGRFSSGSIVKWPYEVVFVVGSTGSAISIIASVVSNGFALTAASLALAGLSHSVLFPTAVAWGSELLPHNVGTSTGILSMAVAAGSMTIPWLTGAISDYAGLRFGILIVAIVGGASMAIPAVWISTAERASKRS